MHYGCPRYTLGCSDQTFLEPDIGILGERLWPRGLAKIQAAINLWLKEMLVITNIFVFECDFLRIE